MNETQLKLTVVTSRKAKIPETVIETTFFLIGNNSSYWNVVSELLRCNDRWLFQGPPVDQLDVIITIGVTINQL